MPVKAALVFALLFWTCLQAQELKYSRVFPTISKNTPLLIHNTEGGSYYVLRYNKKAHDLTLERRIKPSSEIISFTPLKLDSVNSDLYNYASMNYLLYEHKGSMYFVFEKSLNNNKTLYFKHIDSLGKSGGFTAICSLSRESNMLEFDLKVVGVYEGKLLVLASQEFVNQTTKKTISLYDPETKKLLWVKVLPIENGATGYSKAYCLNAQHDLFYVMIKRQIVNYKRKYSKHMQLMLPVFQYESLHLVKLTNQNNRLQNKVILTNFSALHSLTLRCDSMKVNLLAQIAGQLNDHTNTISLYSYNCSQMFNNKGDSAYMPLNAEIKKRLTYYDGTDFEEAADKEFQFLNENVGAHYTYHLTERIDGEVYKELLLWQIQNSNAKVINQFLIPRRMLSSETWSRHKDIGQAGSALSGAGCHVFMAEANANAFTDPNTSYYYQLKKKSSLGNCYLVMYTPENNGKLSRIRLHKNVEFDFIPLDYTSTGTNELVFYLNNGKQEKFAIFSFQQP